MTDLPGPRQCLRFWNKKRGRNITAIGDSVLLDASPYLKELLPGIVIDAKVGRQMAQAADEVEKLKKDGVLGHTIVIELGTNGSFIIRLC